MRESEMKKELIRRIVDSYSTLSSVESVALAGSETTTTSDSDSDLDLYVYLSEDLVHAERQNVAQRFSPTPEVGNTFFEPGDEWIDAQTGIPVDVMFRRTEWMEHQLRRILEDHQASVGYSTCLWHNVHTSRMLFDRKGWFAQLKRKADTPFPEPLRQAIIAKNFPLLRNMQSSYLQQLKRAMGRNDFVSVQHRVAALLASYFDVLFAINRLPHPGEKRLIDFAEAHCRRIPPGMRGQIRSLIEVPFENKIASADSLMDGLESLLKE